MDNELLLDWGLNYNSVIGTSCDNSSYIDIVTGGTLMSWSVSSKNKIKVFCGDLNAAPCARARPLYYFS